MWRLLAVMRRSLPNMRKSPRVADENMIGDLINGGGTDARRSSTAAGWRSTGFSVIYSIVRAPFSLFSCLSHPHVNAADGVWVSSEMARISEINHLVVNDSMRYAILM